MNPAASLRSEARGPAPAGVPGRAIWWRSVLASLLVVNAGCAAAHRSDPQGSGSPNESTADLVWPEGADTLHFQNVEGMIVLRGSVRGLADRDTSGYLVLDTGAGYLALDDSLALWLGIADTLSKGAIGVAVRPLPRVELGASVMDQVSPVLLFDSGLLERVADLQVLGLVGQRLVGDRTLWIDYRLERLALLPSERGVELPNAAAFAASRRGLGSIVSSRAVPVRFRLAGDGKVLIKARIDPMRGGGQTPWLTLALDTGASKCVLFEDVIAPLVSTASWGPAAGGLLAPTLLGVSRARLALANRVEVREGSVSASAKEVEIALLRSPLAQQLQQIAGEPVHGLLGYSFLERFRIACDYPRRVLWLDPLPGFPHGRPSARGHIGIQLERIGASLRTVAVAEGSPAERAGIVAGDEVVSVEGQPARSMSAIALGKLLEGPPGSSMNLVLRRGDAETAYRLERSRIYR